MILPSKKVLSIFVITAALVGAIIIAFGRDKSSEAINFASDLVVGEKISIPENPNWQNELSVVGPLNKQTDTESASNEETVTDTLSTTLMSNYLALKQSGKLDATSAQNLVDQSVDLVDQLGGNVVLDTKLNIVADNGKQSIIEYGENLGNILKNNEPSEAGNELDILGVAISSKNTSKMEELNDIIIIYENVATELEKMPVPKTFVKAHLDITNSIKNIAVALKGTKIVFSDPIKGLMSLQLYQKSSTTFKQAREAIGDFIIKNNIVYKQDSGGYYLLYGL